VLDILRNVIVLGYVTFYQINKFFVNFFSLLTNVFAGRGLETSAPKHHSGLTVASNW